MGNENDEQLAGDIVYHADRDDMSRGELREYLCDALEAALGPELLKADMRYSNGQVCDTLYRCLDLLVTTPEQKQRLMEFLEGEDMDDEAGEVYPAM